MSSQSAEFLNDSGGMSGVLNLVKPFANTVTHFGIEIPRLSKAGWLRDPENGPVPHTRRRGGLSLNARVAILIDFAKRTIA
jgi:hypothetical protein